MLNAPEEATELCTLDGVTYVCIPNGVAIDSEQHPEVTGTMEVVELTPELQEQICNASPHVRLINKRVKDMIAEQYSIEDEIKLLRTAPSEEFDIYNEHAEACRQWGREQKALLGLAQ